MMSMFRWLFRRQARRRHHGHPPCDECKKRSTVVRCIPHEVALCVRCLFIHDEPRVCIYVPDSDKRRRWESREAVKRGA